MNRATRRALRKGKGDMARVLAGIFTCIGQDVSGLSDLREDEAARGAFELYRAGYLDLVAGEGRVSARLLSPPSPRPAREAATLATVADLVRR